MTDLPLDSFLRSLADAYNGTAIVYETNGTPTGVSGAGDIGVASLALSAEIAAKCDSGSGILDTIVRHQDHAPDIFESVLLGALINLANLHLEPAYKLLDGTSTDRRARAQKEWAAIKEAVNG